MVSGTLAVTTTPQSLQPAGGAISGRSVRIQIIGAGTVIWGGKVGVTAGNGGQLASTGGSQEVGNLFGFTMLADLWVATTSSTATLMWVVN